ncbi:heterokaryon incompatibility protein-domain-containing protein, partial [Phaeosphaeriaceae sp. PMI808]
MEGRPLVLLSECHPFVPFTAHRLNPSLPLPFSTFRSWLQNCEENHGWGCDGETPWPAGSGRPGLRVIDVLDQCLKTVPFRSRFVTLSYVWGQATQYRALKSNIQMLETEGSLAAIEVTLPRTIADAMEFTRQMGERYLWVDALCIVQDDSDEIGSLVDHMDLVYGTSLFTIIAAAGDSAESGLPGVRRGSRRPQQYIEEISESVKLMLLPDLESKRGKTVHETRGWT